MLVLNLPPILKLGGAYGAVGTALTSVIAAATTNDIWVQAITTLGGAIVTLGTGYFAYRIAVLPKLQQLHTLSNSALTASQESTLEAVVAQEVLLKRLSGSRPTKPDRIALSALRDRIVQQQKTLEGRREQTAVADEQARKALCG